MGIPLPVEMLLNPHCKAVVGNGLRVSCPPPGSARLLAPGSQGPARLPFQLLTYFLAANRRAAVGTQPLTSETGVRRTGRLEPVVLKTGRLNVFHDCWEALG